MYLLAQLPKDVLAQQLQNGVVLMVLGMAIVFVFLTILVFTTKGVSKLVRTFEKKKPAAPVAQAAPAAVAVASNDAEIAVAIAAAVAKSKS